AMPMTAFLGGNLVLAFLFKSFYFTHLMGFFERNKDLPQAELEHKIAVQGGVSRIAAVLGLLAAFAGIIGAAIVGEMMFGPLPEKI
ncbi:MAG: hypothetical protein KJ667_07860, partial [Alphaproteobacteria bacterium]|nr:hypothetical protein [Alphaproteobacteria bacterium]